MEIREYRERDLPAVVVLLRQLWPDLEIGLDATARQFVTCMESGFEMFCAIDEGRVVGFSEMHFRECLWRQQLLAYMDVLVVDGSYRRRGIGSALLAVAWGKAKRKGCDYLELDSSFPREDAHLFYEAHGFDKTGYTFGKEIPGGMSGAPPEV